MQSSCLGPAPPPPPTLPAPPHPHTLPQHRAFTPSPRGARGQDYHTATFARRGAGLPDADAGRGGTGGYRLQTCQPTWFCGGVLTSPLLQRPADHLCLLWVLCRPHRVVTVNRQWLRLLDDRTDNVGGSWMTVAATPHVPVVELYRTQCQCPTLFTPPVLLPAQPYRDALPRTPCLQLTYRPHALPATPQHYVYGCRVTVLQGRCGLPAYPLPPYARTGSAARHTPSHPWLH